MSFDNLKKRYRKKKNQLKKNSGSGAGSDDVNKAKQALKPYEFLSWIDSFVQMRPGRSNISTPHETAYVETEEENGSETEDFSTEPIEENINEGESQSGSMLNSPGSSCSITDPPAKKTFVKKRKQRKNDINDQYMNEMELSIIKSLKDDLSEKKSETPDAIRGFMITLEADFRQLGEREAHMARIEIQQIMFKYQMARLGSTDIDCP